MAEPTKTDLADHATAWTKPEMVDKFAGKTASDFFKSEIRFMPRVTRARSVLDVGCASGRLVELLRTHLEDPFTFTGVDLVASSIERAVENYPDHHFHCGDYLDSDIHGPFDFVNATGVVQHEPRTAELLERMVSDAGNWLLFDAKVAPIDTDLRDRDASFVTIGDERLYFIVLAWDHLLVRLRDDPRITHVSVYGYRTEPNPRTTVPADLGPFASVGIFCELGDGAAPAAVDTDVPDFLR